MSEEKRDENKKPFIKPEVKKVPLVPKEATLAFCKSTKGSTGPGAHMGACQDKLTMGQTADCSALGS